MKNSWSGFYNTRTLSAHIDVPTLTACDMVRGSNGLNRPAAAIARMSRRQLLALPSSQIRVQNIPHIAQRIHADSFAHRQIDMLFIPGTTCVVAPGTTISISCCCCCCCFWHRVSPVDLTNSRAAHTYSTYTCTQAHTQKLQCARIKFQKIIKPFPCSRYGCRLCDRRPSSQSDCSKWTLVVFFSFFYFLPRRFGHFKVMPRAG